jgi:serine protease Do
MKKHAFAFIPVLVWVTSPAALGQSNAPDDMYVNYDKNYVDAWRNHLQSGRKGALDKTLKEIEESAALLMEECPPAENVRTVNGRREVLSDEDIFSKRENSVFIIGKLHRCRNCTGREVHPEYTGTAFAISKDGVCVTNYHVLKDIIRPNENDVEDSAYFIMTVDKKIYFIDDLLAYSQNNDLAVFKVNTQGDRLSPIPLGKPAQVGAPVFCISHPSFHFYYFSKGIVSRDVSVDSLLAQAVTGYSQHGKPPIRMEITADYCAGSSGGPILDKYGNLAGIVSSATTLSGAEKDKDGKIINALQLVIKDTAPVKALADLLQNKILN